MNQSERPGEGSHETRESDAVTGAPADASVEERLEGAEGSDDDQRLKTLEDIYSDLEGELEGDLDQEGPTRR